MYIIWRKSTRGAFGRKTAQNRTGKPLPDILLSGGRDLVAPQLRLLAWPDHLIGGRRQSVPGRLQALKRLRQAGLCSGPIPAVSVRQRADQILVRPIVLRI